MYTNLFLTTGAFVNSIYVVGGPLYKHLDMYVCMYVCMYGWYSGELRLASFAICRKMVFHVLNSNG